MNKEKNFNHSKVTVFVWWFFCFFLTTSLAKFNYLEVLYGNTLKSHLASIVKQPSDVIVFLTYSLLYLQDIIEVFLLIFVLYIVFCRLLKLKQIVVAFISIGILLLYATLNYFSLIEVKSLLSFDTLQISVSWIADNPSLLDKYIRKRTVVLLLLALFWCALPLIASWVATKNNAIRFINRKIAIIICTSFSFSVLLVLTYNIYFSFKAPLPFNGYWSSSFVAFVHHNKNNPNAIQFEKPEVIQTRYNDLIYSLDSTTGEPVKHIDIMSKIKKRHVVIIGLETAPQKLYEIYDNKTLPGFGSFSKNGIVSYRHFTTSPFTSGAYYSIITGTYPPTYAIKSQYGDFLSDGLGSVLSSYGYKTTYIDSHVIDWSAGNPNSPIFNNLGFQKLMDNSTIFKQRTGKWRESTFDEKEEMEKISFERIKDALLDAKREDKKAFIFLATIFGHYPWVARPENSKASEIAKLNKIITSIDSLFGDFYQFLLENNLEDDIIVVITGDHGLRYHSEFEAVAENPNEVDVSFNVPFMLFAPGLFSGRLLLEHATSHVDIAPTIMEMLGISRDGFLLHGDNMLKSGLNERLIFLMNSGLKQTNYSYRKGTFFNFNLLTKETKNTYLSGNSLFDKQQEILPLNSFDIHGDMTHVPIENIFNEAKIIFDQTGAYFFSRK